jgi:hypothetical protein
MPRWVRDPADGRGPWWRTRSGAIGVWQLYGGVVIGGLTSVWAGDGVARLADLPGWRPAVACGR